MTHLVHVQDKWIELRNHQMPLSGAEIRLKVTCLPDASSFSKDQVKEHSHVRAHKQTQNICCIHSNRLTHTYKHKEVLI
jgi:hypothetical protein